MHNISDIFIETVGRGKNPHSSKMKWAKGNGIIKMTNDRENKDKNSFSPPPYSPTQNFCIRFYSSHAPYCCVFVWIKISHDRNWIESPPADASKKNLGWCQVSRDNFTANRDRGQVTTRRAKGRRRERVHVVISNANLIGRLFISY